MHKSGHPGYDDDSQYPDDEHRDTWCSDFAGHSALHEFCGHHQAAWCRKCDGGTCPECMEDPHCPDCGAALFQEDHDWDCLYAD
jgi:hypothetical protein